MIWRAALILVVGTCCWWIRNQKQQKRHKKYQRGRELNRSAKLASKTKGLRFGNHRIPESEATQHFLVVGTTGSGKSIVQRLLMKDVLTAVKPGSDKRVLIFDAKNDAVPFLHHIGSTCPVFSLNPFEARSDFPKAVAWDIAADITSPARALNLAACLIPAEKGGSNQYFTDAARQVVSAIVESLIRHSANHWTFSQLIYTTLSMERVKEQLSRDVEGRETLENFFGDDRTAYQVFTTVVSRMSYYRPVAGLWQNTQSKLSLRHWLKTESVLLLGTNATAETALSAINEVMFRVLVEEIDMQPDSSTRRTWFWIDEARLSGPLLRGKMLPFLAVKGRSRGACLVLAFQDIDGFREAAGTRIANEIIAQCSHKALLRMESDESSQWASKVIGQYETLDLMQSKQGGLFGKGGSQSEQAARRDAVLSSEFYLIPATNPKNGLTGYFLSPSAGAVKVRISPFDIKPVITDNSDMVGIDYRDEQDQRLNAACVAEAEAFAHSRIRKVPYSLDFRDKNRQARR